MPGGRLSKFTANLRWPIKLTPKPPMGSRTIKTPTTTTPIKRSLRSAPPHSLESPPKPLPKFPSRFTPFLISHRLKSLLPSFPYHRLTSRLPRWLPRWLRRRLRQWLRRLAPTREDLRTFFSVLGTSITFIPVAFFFGSHVAERMTVNGPSMAPLLSPNCHETGKRDHVLAWKWKPARDLQRGMVVSFWTPHDPEKMAIKRVVALEGDVVKTRAPYPLPTVRVPAGHVWVEGEDPARTIDSNTYGPISMSLITARTTHIVWPLSRVGKIAWQNYTDKGRVKRQSSNEIWYE